MLFDAVSNIEEIRFPIPMSSTINACLVPRRSKQNKLISKVKVISNGINTISKNAILFDTSFLKN